jgi:hypothetical protein
MVCSCSLILCTRRASLSKCGRLIFPDSTRQRYLRMARVIRLVRAALAMIPALTMLYEVERAGHELLPKSGSSDLPAQIVSAFQAFFS